MDNTPIHPEDLLPDGVDSAVLNGTQVRKGSVGAFCANAVALAALDPSDTGYAELLEQLRILTPVLAAVGLFDVFTLRSERLAELLALT